MENLLNLVKYVYARSGKNYLSLCAMSNSHVLVTHPELNLLFFVRQLYSGFIINKTSQEQVATLRTLYYNSEESFW